MAILGFHVVVTLVVLTIISKLGSRLSVVQLFLINGLYRYVAPSNFELRSLLPAAGGKEKANPRQRRKQREEEETAGFNIPKQLPLQLRLTPVTVEDLQKFVLFSSVHWLSLFTPLCLVVYVMSETFLYFFPENGDVNVSVLWLVIAVAFVLQVLASLTAYLIANQDERTLLLTVGSLYFLFACVFTMWAERIFDIRVLEAYDHFSANIAQLMVETGATDTLDTRLKSPLLLYISLSVFFAFLSAMLLFPNFRYARIYRSATEMGGSATQRLLLHLAFLSPALTILLFTHPVKQQLVHGPRRLLTESQLDILRVYCTVLTLLLRSAVRRPHLQAHLDTAHEKVQQLQKETGRIRNYDLQKIILQYYTYFNAVVLQYYSPVLLSFFFALLLKTTGGLSWLGYPDAADGPVPQSSTAAMGAIRSIFDGQVCKAVWSYALLITTVINFSLSLLGVVYNASITV